MARPRRSTRDEFLDQFADFDLVVQEQVLELCELIHRQAKRRSERRSGSAGAASNGTGPEQEDRQIELPS